MLAKGMDAMDVVERVLTEASKILTQNGTTNQGILEQSGNRKEVA